MKLGPGDLTCVVAVVAEKVFGDCVSHYLVHIDADALHWGLYLRRAPELVPGAMKALMELYAAGRIKPHISSRFAFTDAPAALALVAGRQSTGKVILTTHP